jgi:hypothetical protein
MPDENLIGDQRTAGAPSAAADGSARLLDEVFKLMAGEPKPADKLERFDGAYYVKRASSHWSKWVGMEATVTLGTPVVDPDRASGKRKDGFSTYLGGNVNNKREVDAGLSWDYVRNSDGEMDRKHFGWRPFYRNTSWHWVNKGDVYWSPGDTVNISLQVVAPGKLRMRIADDEPNPKRKVEIDFRAHGWAEGKPLQFKRVNAIDQAGNEGRPVRPTDAKVTGSKWLETELLYRDGKEIKSVPMVPQRRARIETPHGHADVRASQQEKSRGGERIDIYGKPPKR